MKQDKFENSWSGWNPEAVKDHEIRNILKLSTPIDRLKWLLSMRQMVIKIQEKLNKRLHSDT